MAFKNIIFPPKISFGAIGGPAWKTDLVRTNNGQELRNQRWQWELASYEVSYDARNETEWRQMPAFVRIVHGMADTFRFLDWTDYICASGEGFFVTGGTGSPTQKVMVKRYTFGSYTVDRIITKPISGTVTVIGGGTLDYNTGTSSGNPSAWYGNFHVHARLGVDEMRMESIDKRGDGTLIIGWRNIPILEVRDDQ